MADLTKDQILDFKNYYIPGGDKGFNPQKNKEVIERTILKTKKMRADREKAYREAVHERSEAAVSYLFSRRGAESRNSIEKYFGKAELARLRAEDITTKLKGQSLLSNNF